MRLQVRVTQAHQELLEHLESIDKEYRGKRLVALAAMQLREMQTASHQAQEHPQEQPATTKSDDKPKPKAQQRTAPKWLSGQDHEKE